MNSRIHCEYYQNLANHISFNSGPDSEPKIVVRKVSGLTESWHYNENTASLCIIR